MTAAHELDLSNADLGLNYPEKKPGPETAEAERIHASARNLRFEILDSDWERIRKGLDSLVPKSVQILTSTAANYIGPLGATKMAIESIRGATFAGQKLTPLGRINHFIIQGLNAYAHYLPFKGRYLASSAAYGASWLVDAVQYYPGILSSLRDLAKRGKMNSIETYLSKLEKLLDEAQVKRLFFREEKPGE